MSKQPADPEVRPSFSRLARRAIEKHVPETRTPDAYWSRANNAIWVRWPSGEHVLAYLGLHRHLDWVSGEAGIAREPVEMSALFPLPGVPAAPVPGYRIRLGHLLEGDDRWWPAGESLAEQSEQLEWLTLQLMVKGGAFFRRFSQTEIHAGAPGVER